MFVQYTDPLLDHCKSHARAPKQVTNRGEQISREPAWGIDRDFCIAIIVTHDRTGSYLI